MRVEGFGSCVFLYLQTLWHLSASAESHQALGPKRCCMLHRSRQTFRKEGVQFHVQHALCGGSHNDARLTCAGVRCGQLLQEDRCVASNGPQ